MSPEGDWEEDEDIGHPFVCVVKNQSDWISMTRLEERGIPERVINLLVYGPFEDAVIAMAEIDRRYKVIENRV
jgi:hypothetical protein